MKNVSAEVPRCGGAVVRRCSGAVVQWCRGAEVPRIARFFAKNNYINVMSTAGWLVGVPFALNASAVVVVSASAVRCSMVQCGGAEVQWCRGAC